MRTKWCSRCKTNKRLESFHRYYRSPDGRQGWCIKCGDKYCTEYYADPIKRERHCTRQRAYYAIPKNRRRKDAYYTKYFSDPINRARWAPYRAEWSKFRQLLKTRACPPWMRSKKNREALRAVFEQRDELTLKTGVLHNTDHIWPLNHKDFCGLHVPWNLQNVPDAYNKSKHNKRPDEFPTVREWMALRTTVDNGVRSVALNCKPALARSALAVTSRRNWRSRRESNPHLRFRKPPFYPLNYGNILDVRCQRSEVRRRSYSKTRAE